MYALERYIDAECKLHKRPELLLEVSDQATGNREKTNEKLDRKR